MINYTKTFAKRLLKNVKTMKNLQKTSKKQPFPIDLSKKSKRAKQSVQQSADFAITDFSRVNFLTVTNNQDGQRVDNFLLARLKGLPRSHLYKLIRSDEIRINGKRCKAHDKLYMGDVVRVAPIRLSVREAPIIS